MCVYIYFSTTHPYRVLFFFFLAGIRARTFMSRHHILRCSCLARLLNADALSDRLSGKSQDQEMNTREHFGPLNDRTWLRNTHLVSVYLKKVESAQSWCPAHPTTLGWAEDHQATSKTRLMWKELRHSGHFFFFSFFFSPLSPPAYVTALLRSLLLAQSVSRRCLLTFSGHRKFGLVSASGILNRSR